MEDSLAVRNFQKARACHIGGGLSKIPNVPGTPGASEAAGGDSLSGVSGLLLGAVWFLGGACPEGAHLILLCLAFPCSPSSWTSSSAPSPPLPPPWAPRNYLQLSLCGGLLR